MLTTWPEAGHAVVLAVSRHDRSTTDVYALLNAALDVAETDDDRTKPPCCDEAGAPPVDPGRAATTADGIDHLRRRRTHPKV
jgi:hypothetical protein